MTFAYDVETIGEALDVRIADLAAAQHGVFSRAQALALGASRSRIDRRLRARLWEPMFTGVYRLRGVTPSYRQQLMAACLAWGGGSTISHRAAAALHRLAGCPMGRVEITVRRTSARRGPWIVHRGALASVDITVVEAITVTTVERTLIDLASVVPLGALEVAVDDALRRGLVSMPRLRWAVGRLTRKGRRGITPMRAILAAREPADALPDSAFETMLLSVLRRAGMPKPVAQHAVRSEGRFVARVDLAYPDVRLAVEADGFEWHSGRTAFERDRARLNRLTLAGWRVIHVTWNELTKTPEVVVATIRGALAEAPSLR